jgi:hypothetical protein
MALFCENTWLNGEGQAQGMVGQRSVFWTDPHLGLNIAPKGLGFNPVWWMLTRWGERIKCDESPFITPYDSRGKRS